MNTVTRFRYLFADDRSVYGVLPDGRLYWYPGWQDLSAPLAVDSGMQVGVGWGDFVHVFAGGDGVIYAVTPEGALLWYRDIARDGTNGQNGSTGWAPSSGTQIGQGWDGFTYVFSGAGEDGHEGVIYAVGSGGELFWYRDLNRDGSNSPDGSTGWAALSGSQIGTGWSGFRHVVPGGSGVIYAVTATGELRWYRDDRHDGSNDPSGDLGWATASGTTIDSGWDVFTHLFAGGDGVIFACEAQNYGGIIRQYRDLLRDGTDETARAGGGWLRSDADVARAWQGWQIAGIEGYCWPMSVSPGETVSFHVSAMSPGRATVSYFRLAGRGPQFSDALGSDTDFVADFRATGRWDSDCGWPVDFTFTVPAGPSEWGPGFYAARVQAASGAPFDIPFVVKRGTDAGKVALLVNVNTWNAYNSWGGSSNYTTDRYAKVTLTAKRPNHHLLTSHADSSKGNHTLRSEIWLLSWLKSQGYDVDLYTDLDLERGIDNLHAYKALVLSTHPEYWTNIMMAALHGFLDAGRSLLYLGGNGMYRSSRLDAQTPGGDLDRLFTEQDELAADSYPTFDGKPLLAADVAYPNPQYPNPPGAGLRIRVGHRFIPATVKDQEIVGLSGWNVTAGGENVPAGVAWGASGLETDYWASLPSDVTELARDASAERGAVVACYDTSKGGFVLGVGSVTFVGSLMEDTVLQAIVNNALAEATRQVPRSGVWLGWKGGGSDPRLFYNAGADSAYWSNQVQVGGTTSHGPALAAFNGRLYLAWKGGGDDPRLFYNSSPDGQQWTDQVQVGGTTSHGPALAAFNGRLYLAWKGGGDDPRLFYNSSPDGQQWTDQVQVGGTTSHGPALAAFNGRLYLAWKGGGDDPRLFYNSSPDGQQWTDQVQVGGTTSHGPALAAFNGRLYLAWKGGGDDPRLFYNSSPDGQQWTDQIQVGGTTSHGPALAAFNGRLYLAWKGGGDDPRLFYNSSPDGQQWTDQVQVGGTTSHNPALAPFRVG